MLTMPRITLTRVILAIILITCVTLLGVDIWLELNGVNTSHNHMNANHNQLNHNKYNKQTLSSREPREQQLLSNDKDNQINSFANILSTNRHNYHMNGMSEKPWFMGNGTRRPSSRMSDALSLWPEESPEDRIVNQLMYFPKDYKQSDTELKRIVLYLGRGGWNDLPMGRIKFVADKCPVDRCSLSANANDAPEADAIFFKERFQWPKHRRPAHQIWILFLLECPLHTQLFRNLGAGVFNWTATYRHDSDIVAPYEKFVSYSRNKPKQTTQKNWGLGKTKQVAWFVSNCGARNKRLEYARELSRYIQVDIYGSCGNKKCPRNKAKKCFEMLNKDYKFYLAFENSNCRDYITEKFYVNGLGHNSLDYNLIPIVMGAHPDDYRRSSPPHSYIHVDDFESPKALAKYLHLLSSNPHLYNQYFEWKSSGEFINTYFWCRVCALLHAQHPKPSRSYRDISEWWAPTTACNNGIQRWPQLSQSPNHTLITDSYK